MVLTELPEKYNVLKLIVSRRSAIRGYSPKNSQVDIIIQLLSLLQQLKN